MLGKSVVNNLVSKVQNIVVDSFREKTEPNKCSIGTKNIESDVSKTSLVTISTNICM